jgi:hypothetical protein
MLLAFPTVTGTRVEVLVPDATTHISTSAEGAVIFSSAGLIPNMCNTLVTYLLVGIAVLPPSAIYFLSLLDQCVIVLQLNVNCEKKVGSFRAARGIRIFNVNAFVIWICAGIPRAWLLCGHTAVQHGLSIHLVTVVPRPGGDCSC